MKCVLCGGTYDVSDASKTASILGALLGVGPGILLLGKVVRQGYGGILGIAVGTAAAAAVFMGASVLLGWLTLRLVPRQ